VSVGLLCRHQGRYPASVLVASVTSRWSTASRSSSCSWAVVRTPTTHWLGLRPADWPLIDLASQNTSPSQGRSSRQTTSTSYSLGWSSTVRRLSPSWSTVLRIHIDKQSVSLFISVKPLSLIMSFRPTDWLTDLLARSPMTYKYVFWVTTEPALTQRRRQRSAVSTSINVFAPLNVKGSRFSCLNVSKFRKMSHTPVTIYLLT